VEGCTDKWKGQLVIQLFIIPYQLVRSCSVACNMVWPGRSVETHRNRLVGCTLVTNQDSGSDMSLGHSLDANVNGVVLL